MKESAISHLNINYGVGNHTIYFQDKHMIIFNDIEVVWRFWEIPINNLIGIVNDNKFVYSGKSLKKDETLLKMMRDHSIIQRDHEYGILNYNEWKNLLASYSGILECIKIVLVIGDVEHYRYDFIIKFLVSSLVKFGIYDERYGNAGLEVIVPNIKELEELTRSTCSTELELNFEFKNRGLMYIQWTLYLGKEDDSLDGLIYVQKNKNTVKPVIDFINMLKEGLNSFDKV